MLIRILSLAACIALTSLPLAAATTARDAAVPHYDHILLMIEENRGYRSILDGTDARNLARLARTYGSATQMFAERHPSEPNYVALIGGDTFGIADDDGWFCTPGTTQTGCKGSDAPDFPVHLIPGANLATQLRAKGLAWRAYLEDLPAPGSLAMISPATTTEPAALYAAKHTGFTNFASVHADPNLAQELVGFDSLDADLKAGKLPAFTLIVPNQCNEMHGVGAPLAPADCRSGGGPLIARGDTHAGRIVDALLASPIWADPRTNTALIITWDEDSKNDRLPGVPQSCCVVDAHNPGGGRIPTIVLTNHGPRGMSDPTPYDHYSLLRTIEDALGLDGHLRHADDPTVLPMGPLFGPAKGPPMLTPAIPPQPVPIYSGFDYVTVDAARRRVFAAHTGARALLVVDADSGAVLGQARTGPMHGVAVDPATGHVYTGNGTDDSVGEVDPQTLEMVRSVAVPGPVDALAYDPENGRIYADEDDGTHLFVIDARSMKLVASIVIPGHKPEYLAIDPKTHEVYQNIDDRSEIAVIDPQTLAVKRTIATPEIVGNHPLQYDPEYDQIVVAGSNRVMSVYTPAGRKLGQIAVPAFDQCDLDPTQHVLACAGSGGISRIALQRDGAPHILDTTPVDPGVHTVAIDPTTHAVFAVWAARDGSGDFVRKFTP